MAFIRGGVGRAGAGVYVVNADGSGLRQLLSVPAKNVEAGPAWSPNGRELAVAVARKGDECNPSSLGFSKPGNMRLVIVGAHGRGRIDVPALDTKGHPAQRHSVVASIAWSPNGNRLLYLVWQWNKADECRDLPPGSLLYTISDHGAGRRLALSSGTVPAAAWSPASDRIAYIDYYDNEIDAVNADGTRKSLLVACCGHPGSGLAWGSSGLLFGNSEVQYGIAGLYLANVATKQRRLVATADLPDDPYELPDLIQAVSHDGQTIAFKALANTNNGAGTYLVTLNGTRRQLPLADSVFLP